MPEWHHQQIKREKRQIYWDRMISRVCKRFQVRLTMKWIQCVLAWSQRIVLKIENLLIQWWKWNVTNAQKGKREKKVHTNSVKQTDEWQIFKCLSPALNSYTYMKMIQDTKQTRNNNIMLVVFFISIKPIEMNEESKNRRKKKCVQKMTKRRKHMRERARVRRFE